MQKILNHIVKSNLFDNFILSIIIINSITLGLETNNNLNAELLSLLNYIDKFCLTIFTIEILLKISIYRKLFFKDPWRIFDFIIVFISLLPSSSSFTVIRSLRILRALRMISVVPSLKRVVNGLLKAIPGLSSVAIIMILVFYVGSVMATKLFGKEFPEWFGSIWSSSYSLFQIMTLESWSMGIVRPVMDKFPFAWIFFVLFIIVATFTMLNLFIAVIVNAMQSEAENTAEERAEKSHNERAKMLEEIQSIKKQINIIVNKFDELENFDKLKNLERVKNLEKLKIQENSLHNEL